MSIDNRTKREEILSFLETYLSLPVDVLAAMKKKYDIRDPESRVNTGQRTLFDKAVKKHLPLVIKKLREIGLERSEEELLKQRRKVNMETWDKLAAAAQKLDVSRSSLLRACLRLEYPSKKRR